ncbi:hypothetical protein [Nitrosomonas communis]|uniref:Uncharacterized protein n=1 Tax=Nitrosomonas communis TaxID=44574 RepID=A0A1H2RE50_9PROT|nr:hypothetical protein [Nitrosomonas communis]SDW17687.1 hypothetical protein SAMN05421882_100495 [Nitrosomonas communis]
MEAYRLSGFFVYSPAHPREPDANHHADEIECNINETNVSTGGIGLIPLFQQCAINTRHYQD